MWAKSASSQRAPSRPGSTGRAPARPIKVAAHAPRLVAGPLQLTLVVRPHPTGQGRLGNAKYPANRCQGLPILDLPNRLQLVFQRVLRPNLLVHLHSTPYSILSGASEYVLQGQGQVTINRNDRSHSPKYASSPPGACRNVSDEQVAPRGLADRHCGGVAQAPFSGDGIDLLNQRIHAAQSYHGVLLTHLIRDDARGKKQPRT